jgi:hypothetical protein
MPTINANNVKQYYALYLNCELSDELVVELEQFLESDNSEQSLECSPGLAFK